MMQKLFIGLFLSISLLGFSQEPDKDAGGTVMRREFSFGLNFNANAGANGWAQHSIIPSKKHINTNRVLALHVPTFATQKNIML